MRILIADNHAVVREGLKLVLDRIDIDKSVIECENFIDALEKATNSGEINLALIDLRLPGMNGVEGVSKFHESFPDIPIIVISGYHGHHEILAAFDKGAMGFVSKNMTNDALIGAVRLVLAGERYVPPDILSATEARFASSHGSDDARGETNPLGHLTAREREVLAELIKGHQNKVIARNLGIQEVTVKLHLVNIFKKLGVANRTQALMTALDFGWEG